MSELARRRRRRLTLGVHASQGLGGDLVTTGPYQYSRNPQYVGTIPAVLGYAIICDSILALITALLVAGWCVLVPFAEESWCREHLAGYGEYSMKVPRFFGRRRSCEGTAPQQGAVGGAT